MLSLQYLVNGRSKWLWENSHVSSFNRLLVHSRCSENFGGRNPTPLLDRSGRYRGETRDIVFLRSEGSGRWGSRKLCAIHTSDSFGISRSMMDRRVVVIAIAWVFGKFFRRNANGIILGMQSQEPSKNAALDTQVPYRDGDRQLRPQEKNRTSVLPLPTGRISGLLSENMANMSTA